VIWSSDVALRAASVVRHPVKHLIDASSHADELTIVDTP
jgi:hypothetical protein